MATKPWDQLSAKYKRRLELGRKAGKSIQASRGHRRREHLARRQGDTYTLSANDRAFLAKQKKKTGDRVEFVFGVKVVVETKEARFARARALYAGMTPEERHNLRVKQQTFAARFRAFNRNRNVWRNRYGKAEYSEDEFDADIEDDIAPLIFYGIG